jgi:hypothetical protein
MLRTRGVNPQMPKPKSLWRWYRYGYEKELTN